MALRNKRIRGSRSGHKFSEVPRIDIPRSTFDRSHNYKTTFNSDYLIPVFCDEALPSDTFNVRMTAFTRLATPIHPIMDDLYMTTHWFSIPMRLLWNNWERFNGAQDNPGDSIDYTIPTMTSPVGGYANETLSDYFGIPTQVPGLEHSAMWHRAYNLIWNEWFRSEDLQDSVVVDKGDAASDPADYVLLKRGKRHDYFSSALPFAQKGVPVEIPLGTKANIAVEGDLTATNYGLSIEYGDGRGFMEAGATYVNPDTTPHVDPGYELFADLSSATAATINQLRLAFSTQRYLELNARAGSRYTEILRSHFSVVSDDARLQRPEFLGSKTTSINISPVAQTSSTDATSPQANLSAVGTGVMNEHGFTKSFTEHCLLIGLVSVSAPLTYQQGLNRQFSRSTLYDFYWPAFAHIGEQSILNKEIYAQGSANLAEDALTFGYAERNADYRYKPSLVTGKFRSNDALTLDAWHLAIDFGSLPTLGSDFIQSNVPLERAVAVTTEPEFLFDSIINIKAARPLPLYGVPGGIRF